MADKAKLFVMPAREIDSDKEEVISQMRDSQFGSVLVIMENTCGNFEIITNQGDAGGVLLFLERFKAHLIAKIDSAEIVRKPETPA